MLFSGHDLEFWAAGFLLNLTLLVVLWYRKRARVFPFFTALISFMIGKSIVLYLISRYGTKNEYRLVYWALAGCDTILQLFVVYEVATRVFRPLNIWAADLRQNFLRLTGLCVSIAGVLTMMANPPTHTWLQSFCTRGNLFAALLMSELFVTMMALSVLGGYPWKTHVATIAQGMGLYALIGVMIDSGHAYLGVGLNTPALVVLSQIRMLTYLGCVAYWIFSLSRDEVPSRTMTAEMRDRVLQLQNDIAYDLQYLRSRKNW